MQFLKKITLINDPLILAPLITGRVQKGGAEIF